MKQIIPIKCDGRINRRDLANLIDEGEVLDRTNFMVIGNGKEKRNRKVPGASRFSSQTLGSSYNSAYRYYTKANVRKSFGHNAGKIYHIDDNGIETEVLSAFMPTAKPCWEVMRISSNDILFVSEGISTGLYSHDGNISNTFQKETSVTLNFVGMLAHLDRLFGFEEDSEDLYGSKTLEPTNFTDSTDAFVITIGPKRGSKIMGIALLYGTIYIFKQDSIWRLTGRTPAEFNVEEVHPSLGCAARGSIQNTDRGIIFLGSDFEWHFFGGTIESTVMLTYKLAVGGDSTKNLVPLINKLKTDSICSTFHDKIYRCSFVGAFGNTNEWEYCFNTINETDFLTYGFNISSYLKWDRQPDQNELFTGRTDLGRLMKMNVGLNVDNGATNPSMYFKLQTKFVGSGDPRNFRAKRAFFNCGVLGAEPIRAYYYLDCRIAQSDAGNDVWITRGETKAVGDSKIASQTAITSRVNLKYAKSKGQSISFAIDHVGRDVDFELASINLEAIVKPTKFSEKVAA